MAPFNKCSCCQIRTRKVIRHPITKKNIYVCPACFKNKKYQEKGNLKKVQPEEDIEEKKEPTENVQEKILQNDVGEEMPTGSTTNDNVPLKIKPPLMEIVVMNNRKYIAVSETADAMNE